MVQCPRLFLARLWRSISRFPRWMADQTGDVMIMPGGSATVTVTAAGFVGDVTLDGAAEDGTVTATEAGEMTVTATDGIDHTYLL